MSVNIGAKPQTFLVAQSRCCVVRPKTGFSVSEILPGHPLYEVGTARTSGFVDAGQASARHGASDHALYLRVLLVWTAEIVMDALGFQLKEWASVGASLRRRMKLPWPDY